MNPILTIAIPTITSRRNQFTLLYEHIRNQIKEYKLTKKVELIFECDNKEISIGAKRDLLIKKAKGKYIVMIDDDDWLPYNYCNDVLSACEDDSDCIGYLEDCVFDWNHRATSCISLRYKSWMNNVGVYDYVRTPFFKVPIKTEICRQVGCADLRFGEDSDFAKRIYPLLKSETFIDKKLYIYRYKFENHNSKYGFIKSDSNI